MTTPKAPVLIIGARSDMARGIAAQYAKLGHPLQLAARNHDTLERDVADFKIRYNVDVTAHECDVTDTASHDAFIEGLPALPAIAVCAVGVLGDQDADAGDIKATNQVFDTNFVGPALLLEKLAAKMVELPDATAIVGIGSVAGDRGRGKNYIYGSAKAGFAAYLSGMRQKYVDSTLQIMTVKPGFVRTAMTAGMETPAPLTTDADAFAERVVKAQQAGKLVYYDLRWRVLMSVICHVPEPIFKKMKF
ncbi:MAG: SDR family oxidoreductase [Litoreibacter sp.]|uniref:SDR family oxidoreductase n=1 Tax=Litoreibacter sp. TaxID=1969459 RepID=UPI00329982BB